MKALTASEKKAQILANKASQTTPTVETEGYKPRPKQYEIPQTASVSLENILSKRIDNSIVIKPIIPVTYIAGSRFAVKGDISMISGKPKAGKSTITKMVLATALMKEVPDDLDTLTIRSNYAGNDYVIYIDTEQNPADTFQFYNEVLEIAGQKENPPKNFIVLNWRDLDYTECMEHLVSLFHTLPNIHMIVLDGITDLIPSANDETSSVILVRYLMKESTLRNACIIAVIHENGESGKMRGHIGAEAARKCQGTISIRYDDAKNVRVIKPLFLRRGKMFEDIYWNNNEGIPQSCTAEIVEEFKNAENLEEKKNQEAKAIVQRMYLETPKAGLKQADLMKFTKMFQSSKTAESADACRKRASRNLEKIKTLGLIEERNGLFYTTLESQIIVEEEDETPTNQTDLFE